MATNSRENLLVAAETVIIEKGFAHLTLEAVAAQANLSKGGLLYHFPTKDALIEALVTRSADHWREHYHRIRREAPAEPGGLARGLIEHLTDLEDWTEEVRGRSAAIFTGLANNPQAIGPMVEADRELQEMLANDGLPPGVSEALVSGINGLWLKWVFGLVSIDPDHVIKVRKALIHLLDRSLEEMES